MSKQHTQKSQSKGPVRRRDLTEMVTEPIMAHMTAVTTDIVKQIQDVAASVEMLARQKARELQEKK